MATKVQGLDKLRAKLRRMPQEARAEIGKAMETGAAELVAMQKRLAPVSSGDLQRSIGYTKGAFAPENSNVRGVSAGSVVADPDLSITVHAGDAKAFYAAFIEFGTAPHKQPNNPMVGYHHPGSAAHPFFFPAYRALKRRIKGRISRATTKAAKTVAGAKS